MLIEAEALATQLGEPGQVIIDCRYNLLEPGAGRQAWANGHIPGALYADLAHDLAGPKFSGSGRHPLPDPTAFAARVAGWGIGPGVLVVGYDDAGGQMAARLWWLLRSLGHREVALLDGGYPAWLAAGLPISTSPPQPRLPMAPYPAAQAMPVVETPALVASLNSRRWQLLDARARARFRGEQEPIDRVAGHVPGARNAPFTETLDQAGRFRSVAELAAYFTPLLRGKPIEAVAAMCGSGITGCHTLFALERAGLPGAALYAGSWSEWIQSPDRPVAVGDE